MMMQHKPLDGDMTTMMKEPLDEYTMVDAARLIKVSERTIRRAVKAGQLWADMSNPKKARIRREDLERWQQERVQRHARPLPMALPLIPITSPEAQALLQRIEELELQVRSFERQGDEARRKVKPINLRACAALHNVAASEYQRAINMAVLPVVRQDEVLLLDGKGQHAFWRALHELPSFRPCEACPH